MCRFVATFGGDTAKGEAVDHIHVEYVGGPLDGRRAILPAGRDGLPPRLRAEETPAVYDSWLDGPAAPPEVHRYDRNALDGDVWQYLHRGTFE